MWWDISLLKGISTDPALFFVILILIGTLGACLGSFASAIAYRAPRGESWISEKGKGARSRCPQCGLNLTWRDLIPLISWLFTRGRCRMCNQAIGLRYPALELAGAIFSLLSVMLLEISPHLILVLSALPFVLALFILSCDGNRFPHQIVAILFFLGLLDIAVFSIQLNNPGLFLLDRAAAGVALFLIGIMADKLRSRWLSRRSKTSPGASGEILFLGVTGIWLGVGLLPVFLICAGFFGLIAAGFRVPRDGNGQATMPIAHTASFFVTLIGGTKILALLLS